MRTINPPYRLTLLTHSTYPINHLPLRLDLISTDGSDDDDALEHLSSDYDVDVDIDDDDDVDDLYVSHDEGNCPFPHIIASTL